MEKLLYCLSLLSATHLTATFEDQVVFTEQQIALLESNSKPLFQRIMEGLPPEDCFEELIQEATIKERIPCITRYMQYTLVQAAKHRPCLLFLLIKKTPETPKILQNNLTCKERVLSTYKVPSTQKQYCTEKILLSWAFNQKSSFQNIKFNFK